ncbi:restriction endonuclease subunit S [Finegoldia magna]|uniref:restriction endonuclease subunit S n=1 Tax=Finegoldia magna TaxID=1260 RepID=UPI001CE13E95|nr:restriction endonuclease subunit S [Finegoldia magna]MCA5587121.1 restriction endonuclease subunit S [Finegoldia magna]
MDNIKNVPSIRFDGYDDDWDITTFSDEVKIFRGLTYNPSNLSDYGSGIRVLRSSNIKNDVFVLNDDDVFVDRSAINITYAKNGNILITAANGSTNLVGKHAIVDKLKLNSTVHGGFMLLGEAKEPYFINALMGSNWYKDFIMQKVSGGNGAIGNLKKSDFDNEILHIPSKNEQAQIGNFFKNIDEKLELEKEKHQKLVNFKKAMLDDMFPKEGERTPKIRIEGFDDEWNINIVDSIFILNQGIQVPIDKQFTIQEKNMDRFIRIIDLTNNKEKPRYIKAVINKNVYVSEEDLFMVRYGTPGKIGFGFKGIIANNMFRLIPRTKTKLNTKFFNYYFESLESTIFSKSISSSMPAISFSVLKKCNISHPSLEEQGLIGNFFKNLDEKIEISEKKIEKIENFKKAMLDKMFV